MKYRQDVISAAKDVISKNHTRMQDAAVPYAEWEELFRAEKLRGIRMGSFFGAEPAFQQELLALGAQYIPYGNISTNGSIYIDRNIPMRVHISCWGMPETEKALRGESCILKALDTYAGDERAIICFTLTPKNIDDTPEVVNLCRDKGLPVTFNMFSPTLTSNISKMDVGKNNSLAFNSYSLTKARNIIDELIDYYPEDVFYTHKYNRWITESSPRYSIDGRSGIAVDCGSRLTKNYRYYSINAKREFNAKCIHPSIQCKECRVYGAGYSNRFFPRPDDVTSIESFSEWLEHMEMAGKIFFTPKDAKEISKDCISHEHQRAT